MSAKTYRFQTPVEAYELDSFGHVNHARFLHYLESARWRILMEEDLDLPKLRGLGVWPAIANIDIQYVKPVFFGDTLSILSRFTEIGRSTMRIEQIIYKGSEEIKVCQAKIRSILVDNNGRPTGFPSHLHSHWKSLVHPEPLIT